METLESNELAEIVTKKVKTLNKPKQYILAKELNDGDTLERFEQFSRRIDR